MKNENNLGSTSQFEEAYQCLLDELSVWKGRLVQEPSFFIQSVTSTLLKYRDFSLENFKADYFTPVLDKITKQWLYHCDESAVETSFTLNDSEALDTSLLMSSFIFKDEAVCTSCNEYRAHLDHLEIQNVRETEAYEERLRALTKELDKTSKDYHKVWDKLREGFSLEKVYVEAVSNMRRDMENLLDCELPSIEEDPLETVPLLWKEVRKVLGLTAKKARGKGPQERARDFYTCTVTEFKQHLEDSLEMLRECRWKKQNIKVSMGELSATVQIEADEPAPVTLTVVDSRDELRDYVIALTHQMNQVYCEDNSNTDGDERVIQLTNQLDCMKEKLNAIKELITHTEWMPHPPIKL